MKYALISEEQIKQVQDALEIGIDFANDQITENLYKWGDRKPIQQQEVREDKHLIHVALAIIQSLKVQEPVGYKLKKPYTDIFTDRQVEDFELVNWTPLYAMEQP